VIIIKRELAMRKFFSAVLVLSFLLIPADLFAGAEKGALLHIHKKSGDPIQGELIAVKQRSLVLQNPNGADETVDIGDVREIRVVTKSKALYFAGAGFLVSGIGLYATGSIPSESGVFFDLGGALIGAGIGAVIGAVLGTDERIRVEWLSEAELERVLEKLRKRARMPDVQ
jgi:hypothetical protein